MGELKVKAFKPSVSIAEKFLISRINVYGIENAEIWSSFYIWFWIINPGNYPYGRQRGYVD